MSDTWTDHVGLKEAGDPAWEAAVGAEGVESASRGWFSPRRIEQSSEHHLFQQTKL